MHFSLKIPMLYVVFDASTAERQREKTEERQIKKERKKKKEERGKKKEERKKRKEEGKRLKQETSNGDRAPDCEVQL